MPKFKIEVCQVIREERRAIIEVDAADAETAEEQVINGEIDLPSADSAAWSRSSELQNETVTALQDA